MFVFAQDVGLKMAVWRRFSVLLLMVFVLLPFCGLEAATKKPLKIFILAGQSNMQGHAKISTMEHIGMDPKTAPWLKELQNRDGSPAICKDIWISYLSTSGLKEGKLTAGYGASGEEFGPELMFGMTLRKQLDGPILIIKAAWGGKSLFTDFRPPSAGVFEDKEKESGHYFRLAVNHVNDVLSNLSRVYPDYDKNQGYELCGMVWFQGWNDMVNGTIYPKRFSPGGYDAYSKLLAQFIDDMREELSVPKLPFVIGVMGMGGATKEYRGGKKRYAGLHQNFRDAMAAPTALPRFKGNVVAVRTEKYWDPELSELKLRDVEVGKELKKARQEKRMSRDEIRKLKKELLEKEFTELELRKLTVGVSDKEFHYLGSGKVMAGIGIGFAEAVLSFLPQKK